MDIILFLYKNVLWQHKNSTEAIAYCPDHRNELDVLTEDGEESQLQSLEYEDQIHFICPVDEKTFEIPSNNLRTMIRRFISARKSETLKDADIVSIDGYQVPIAKAEPVQKDDEYWVQCRINATKKGKQLVVYVGKRGDEDKAQIFVDTENDKITFDQNNIHPNEIFTTLVADFKSGKSVRLHDKLED